MSDPDGMMAEMRAARLANQPGRADGEWHHATNRPRGGHL